MGIADVTGRAVMSTGEEKQVNEKSFFKEAVSGNNYITEKEKGDASAVAAVPIYGSSKNITGVLFGELKLENMGLFEQYMEEDEFKCLYLIDGNGNHILGTSSGGWQKNLFQMLDGRFEKTDYGITSVEQIREYMDNDENILYVMDFPGEKEVGVIVPVADSDWYVFEVTGWQAITKEINYYQKHMIYLTVKVLILFLVLGASYVRYAVGERKKIKKLYTDLCLNEEAYRVTVEHSNQCIFTYDAIEEKIYFVNDNYKKFGIRKQCVELSRLLEKLKKDNMMACARISRIASSVFEHIPEIERELFLKTSGDLLPA